MLLRSLLLAFACLGTVSAAEAAEGGSASRQSWSVHLKSGKVLKSSRKPIAAFGEFRYWDERGRTVLLALEKVDLKATRAANKGKQAQKSAFMLNSTKVAELPPSVTLYSATWCPQCPKAKTWLAARGVSYRLVEVDRLSGNQRDAALRALANLGSRGYPTLVVGGQVVIGYNPRAYDKLMPSETPPKSSVAPPRTQTRPRGSER